MFHKGSNRFQLILSTAKIFMSGRTSTTILRMRAFTFWRYHNICTHYASRMIPTHQITNPHLHQKRAVFILMNARNKIPLHTPLTHYN